MVHETLQGPGAEWVACWFLPKILALSWGFSEEGSRESLH